MSAGTAETAAPGAAGRDWLQKNTADPVERLPKFGECMMVMAELWSDSFRALAGTEGEITFKGLRTAKMSDLPLREVGLPIYAALRIASWGTVAGIILDRSVVLMAVQAFFGGGEDEDDAAGERPLSPIEMRIVDVIGGQIATALTASLKSVLPTRVEFDRTLAKPDPTFLGKPATPLMVAGFALAMFGRTVQVDVLIPQGALDAQSGAFSDEDAPPVLDGDDWSRQLKSEVSRATLRVEAGIPLRPMSLGAIARLRVGQVLELPVAAGSNVLLQCGEEQLFRCDLGQSAGFYTVRVDEALERTAPPPRKTR